MSVVHRIENRAFDLLHPRAKKGTPNAGQFIDVADRLTSLGSEWDQARGAWMVPKDRRDELKGLLDEAGFAVTEVPEGMQAATDKQRQEFGIPPAWTDVFVNPEKGADLMAIGRDQKGREQRTYSAAYRARQDKEKFGRVAALSRAMPEIDDALDRDAGSNPAAAALLLVRTMGLRPGSDRDTMANAKAFGASNLQRRHVHVSGDEVRLSFIGKGGKDIKLELNDHRLAKTLSRHMRGKNGNDRLFDTTDGAMRDWMSVNAPGFKPKDFRTHLATSTAKAMAAEMPTPTTPKELKRNKNAIGDQVASLLGNTRAMALGSYIDPTVFKDWENTETVTAAEAKKDVDRFTAVQDRLDEVMRFGLEDWPDKGEVAHRILGDAKDTQELHTTTLPDGRQAYTAARKVEHDRIVGKAMAKPLAQALGDNHPAVQKLLAGRTLSGAEKTSLRAELTSSRGGGKPRALFMAGGPASGKSSALREDPDLEPPNAITINPDDLKAELPEFQQMVKGREKYAANGAHEESSDLGKRLHQEAMDLGLNVVIDGTGDSKGAKKFVAKHLDMAKAGYDVDTMYVTIDTDEAVVRATLRAMHEGRWVPTPELRRQHAIVSANYEVLALLEQVRSLKVYDNNGDRPVLVAESRYGHQTVIDKRRHDRFLAKREEWA